MALSPHSRHFTLHVTNVDVELFDGGASDFDMVTVMFHGKVLPSTKQRLLEAITNGSVAVKEEKLA